MNIVLADLPHRASINDVRRSSGTGGAWPESRVSRGTGIPCRRAAVSVGDLEIAMLKGAAVTHAIYFLPGQVALEVADEITIDETIYYVTASDLPSEPAYYKVLAVERQPGP